MLTGDAGSRLSTLQVLVRPIPNRLLSEYMSEFDFSRGSGEEDANKHNGHLPSLARGGHRNKLPHYLPKKMNTAEDKVF